MPKCKDCVHYKICEAYVTPEESFPEVDGGCGAFRSERDAINDEVSKVISEIRARLHDRAVHGYGPVSGYVLTREIEAILNEYRQKYSRKKVEKWTK